MMRSTPIPIRFRPFPGLRHAVVGAACGVCAIACVGGGTGLGVDLVSDAQVEQLSQESWERLRSERPESRDASHRAAADRVAGRLLQTLPGSRRGWEVVVFQGDEANAFALPGGKINAIAGALGAGAQYGVLLPYSRNQELEADAFGVMLMAEAGYDPRAALELWESMSEQGGARPPELLSTHPAPGQRIQRLATLMPQALARYRGR